MGKKKKKDPWSPFEPPSPGSHAFIIRNPCTSETLNADRVPVTISLVKTVLRRHVEYDISHAGAGATAPEVTVKGKKHPRIVNRRLPSRPPRTAAAWLEQSLEEKLNYERACLTYHESSMNNMASCTPDWLKKMPPVLQEGVMGLALHPEPTALQVEWEVEPCMLRYEFVKDNTTSLAGLQLLQSRYSVLPLPRKDLVYYAVNGQFLEHPYAPLFASWDEYLSFSAAVCEANRLMRVDDVRRFFEEPSGNNKGAKKKKGELTEVSLTGRTCPIFFWPI